MAKRTRTEREAAVFAQLEQAAAVGARCPTRDAMEDTHMVTALAHAGKIAVEVSAGNWRRVTILQGEHAGKSTAANPKPNATIYMTIDKSGTRIKGRVVDAGATTRQQPSKPGPLRPYAGKG